MKRNLKTFGLALTAVCVLSAVVASAAWGLPKLTPVPEEYPIVVKGEQATTNVFQLEGGRKIECAFVNFEGTVTKLEAEASQMTFKPAYVNCTGTILGNVTPATITLNGCDFLLTYSETTAGTIAAEGWEVTGDEIHIQCPIGASMEIHVYTSAANDVSNTPICTYRISPQTASGDLDYKLTNKDANGNGTHGAINSTLEGITTARVSGTAVNCGAAQQAGKLTGQVKFEIFNEHDPAEMLRGKFED